MKKSRGNQEQVGQAGTKMQSIKARGSEEIPEESIRVFDRRKHSEQACTCTNSSSPEVREKSLREIEVWYAPSSPERFQEKLDLSGLHRKAFSFGRIQ